RAPGLRPQHPALRGRRSRPARRLRRRAHSEHRRPLRRHRRQSRRPGARSRSMNPSPNEMAGSPSGPPPIAPAMPVNRLLEWSVRREFWENRSLYIAPMAVAAVFLFGTSIAMIHLPQRRQATLALDAASQQAAIEKPYDVAAMVILFTVFLVGV